MVACECEHRETRKNISHWKMFLRSFIHDLHRQTFSCLLIELNDNETGGRKVNQNTHV